MLNAFFVHFARGLFEPLWGCFLAAFVWFIFRRWNTDRLETCLVAGSILFMILWRVLMPINSDRYVLILIPAAIAFTLFLMRDLAQLAVKAHPRRGFAVLALLLLLAELGVAFHHPSEEGELFAMLEKLQQDAASHPGPVRVAANRNVSCFLPEKFIVIHTPFEELEKVVGAGPRPDYCLFKVNLKKDAPHLESFGKLTLLQKRSPGKKSKTVFFLWKNQ